MKAISIPAILLGAIFFLAACGGGMSGMSNQELAAKSDECVRRNPTSPGKVTACENIRKECERRRKDKNYAC